MRLHYDLPLAGAGPAGPGDDFGPGLLTEAAVMGTPAAAAAPAAAQTFSASAYPYSAVVYITDRIGDEDLQGSGVLISPDEVLTASHVVYQAGLGVATDIEVAPGYSNGTMPFGYATGAVSHYSQVGANDTITLSDSQSDYAIIHLSQPFTATGNMGVQANFAGGPVHVTGYPGAANGTMIDSPQTVAVDPAYTLLDGTALGQGSSGGPVWIYGADALPYVVGLVSSESPVPATNGLLPSSNVQITGAVSNQIAAWVNQDDKGTPAPSVQVYDRTLGRSVPDLLTHFYAGPAAGVQSQYVDLSPDSLNIAAASPNYFIHTGSGNDAVSVLSGTNIVDGGGGSNFLSGGTGTDTFYVDSRGAASDIWSTVSKFHAGDSATVWGVSPGLAAVSWADNQGAAGSAGLTLHATSKGRPTASLTLAGFTQADVASQRLNVQYGCDASSLSSYLYIHANR